MSGFMCGIGNWFAGLAGYTLTACKPDKPDYTGKVCMDGLCMDKTEVTESAYAAVMGKSPSSNGPQMPATMVTYQNAKDFCEQKSSRLPTREEWYMFAGSHAIPIRDGELKNGKGEKEANFNSSGPMNVGSFPPNSNGMYDMAGNVWEWVSGGNFYDLEGGSWRCFYTDFLPPLCRSDIDTMTRPNENLSDVGFRCVVAPQASK